MSEGYKQDCTRIFLVRHGKTVEEEMPRCCGWIEVELSPEGETQMRCVADRLSGEPVTAVYSSDLGRALKSARIIAQPHKLEAIELPELREINFGRFDGLTYEEIAEQFPQDYREFMERPTQYRFPQGESYSDLKARLLPVFQAILSKHSQQTVVIVAHGGVNRMILSYALGMSSDNLFRIDQPHGCLSLIEFFGDTPVVRFINESYTSRNVE